MNARLRYLSATLAVAAVALGYAVMQGRAARPAPRLEARPAHVARPAPPPPAPPTAREILDRRTTLTLTGDQTAKLAALDRKWRDESAPLEAALHEAEQEFSRFMKEAQASGRTSLQDIQRRSADVQALSAALRERRLLHAEAAAQVLTDSQRRALSVPGSPQSSGGDR